MLVMLILFLFVLLVLLVFVGKEDVGGAAGD